MAAVNRWLRLQSEPDCMRVLDDLLVRWMRASIFAGSLLTAFSVDLDRTVGLFGIVPLAVAIHGAAGFHLSSLSPARLVATVGSATMTVAWLLATLRWSALGAAAPLLMWGFAIATTTGAAVLAQRLSGAMPAVFQIVDATYESEPRVIAARLA